MAKSKTPFFGLDSAGTIGNSLTSQHGRTHTILRSKPTPAYRRTLPQMYQRWLYEDYAYLWTQQSLDTRQSYQSSGSRYHLTGFQYWMKDMLTRLPDIVAMWYLDTTSGNIALDSSRNNNHGLIIGASPATGLIDGALYFILNDYITIPSSQLNFTAGDFSLIATIRFDSMGILNTIINRGADLLDGYHFLATIFGQLVFTTNQPAAQQFTATDVFQVPLSTFMTIGFSRSGASVRLFKNGVDITDVPAVHIDPASCPRSAQIGIYDDLILHPLNGIVDHMILFNRYLSEQEHLNHSLRRYSV